MRLQGHAPLVSLLGHEVRLQVQVRKVYVCSNHAELLYLLADDAEDGGAVLPAIEEAVAGLEFLLLTQL